MEILKTTGIVIKTLDYQESSKIIFIYSENGKKSFLLNGVKKIKSDKRILAQIFQKIELSFYKKSKFPKPIDGDIIDYYYEIKSDIYRLDKMAQICDLIYYFSDEINDNSKAYFLLDNCLNKLNDNSFDYEIVFLIFTINLLTYLGMDLNFDPILNKEFKEFLECNYELKLEQDTKSRYLNFIIAFYKNYLEYSIKSLF